MRKVDCLAERKQSLDFFFFLKYRTDLSLKQRCASREGKMEVIIFFLSSPIKGDRKEKKYRTFQQNH